MNESFCPLSQSISPLEVKNPATLNRFPLLTSGHQLKLINKEMSIFVQLTQKRSYTHLLVSQIFMEHLLLYAKLMLGAKNRVVSKTRQGPCPHGTCIVFYERGVLTG